MYKTMIQFIYRYNTLMSGYILIYIWINIYKKCNFIDI